MILQQSARVLKEFRRSRSQAPMLRVSLSDSKTARIKARKSLIFVLHKYQHLQTLRLRELITGDAIPSRLLISGKDRPPLLIALPRYTKLSTQETRSPSTAVGDGRSMFLLKEATNLFILVLIQETYRLRASDSVLCVSRASTRTSSVPA